MSQEQNRGYSWDSSYASDWKKAGKELRREITHLKRPLYTDSLTLSRIVFSASTWSGDDYLRSKLGHDIKVQFELYGCPNYDLDKSKLCILKLKNYIKQLKTILKL